MLARDDLGPLVIFIPGFLFGKVFGFVIINFIAYCILGLRRIFEDESKKTGRDDF